MPTESTSYSQPGPREDNPMPEPRVKTERSFWDVDRIRKLIELMKEHDLAEIDLRQSQQRIRLCRGPQGVPVVSMPPGAMVPATMSAPAPLADRRPPVRPLPLPDRPPPMSTVPISSSSSRPWSVLSIPDRIPTPKTLSKSQRPIPRFGRLHYRGHESLQRDSGRGAREDRCGSRQKRRGRRFRKALFKVDTRVKVANYDPCLNEY